MTPGRLKQIRERCEQATSGPWVQNGPFGKSIEDHGWRSVAGSPFIHVTRDQMKSYPQCVVDADFIAHARTDIPLLLDEIERLRDAYETDRDDIIEVMDRTIEAAAKVAKEWPCTCPEKYAVGGTPARPKQYHGTDCENEVGRFIAEKILKLRVGET